MSSQRSVLFPGFVFLIGLMTLSGCGSEQPVEPNLPSDTSSPAGVASGLGTSSASFWVASVADDGRQNFDCPGTEFGPADHVVGPADCSSVSPCATSLGPTGGNFLILEMALPVFDGAGDDLIVHEIGSGAPGAFPNDFYNVYVSSHSDHGFVLVDEVTEEGSHAIDLSSAGSPSGRFVMLEQAQDTDDFDSSQPCASYGADIDAVEGLNTCPPIDDVCAQGISEVHTTCPPDGTYRNHGEYVSCVAHAATEFLAGFEDCFTTEELDEIHGCIVSNAARSQIGFLKLLAE